MRRSHSKHLDRAHVVASKSFHDVILHPPLNQCRKTLLLAYLATIGYAFLEHALLCGSPLHVEGYNSRAPLRCAASAKCISLIHKSVVLWIKVSNKVFNIGPLINESPQAKKRVFTGVKCTLGSRWSVLGPNEILKGQLSFCRHYLSSVMFVDLLGSANCEKIKSNRVDAILSKFDNSRSYGISILCAR